ncbi:MAG: dicarboxylate/amino acid:cation symporter [Thermoanaerobaculia bacterium]
MSGRSPSLSTWALLALVCGLALGMLGHGWNAPFFGHLETIVKPFGTIWMAALQFVLLPLIAGQLLSAITGAAEGARVGRLGLRAMVLIVVMLTVAGIFTAVVTPPILSLYRVDPAMAASIEGATEVPAEARHETGGALPNNLFEAARKGQILPILIFSALFGAAVRRLPEERRVPLTRLFQGLAEAMLIVVRWILLGTPAGVFGLTYVAALHSGGAAAGMMTAFIVLVCALLAVCIVLLYPITALLGRTSMRTFARAVAPAQLVAIGTQSSIASLPALVQGGTDHLGLPAKETGFVLPLCVSVFKLNRTVSATAKLLFLAYIYGVPIGIGTFTVFLVTVILLSFSAVGVPQGGVAFSTLPAYVAAGIPLEGIIVLEATAMAPDMLKTVLNVTANMSVATLLSRSARGSAGAEVEGDPVPALAPESIV